MCVYLNVCELDPPFGPVLHTVTKWEDVAMIRTIGKDM